jgi:hypothetical protein
VKKQTTVIALGALLSLAMTASSFAQGNGHPRHARSRAASTYSGYYNSAAPEGSYTRDPYSYTTGGLSGAIGGIGH